MPYVLGYRLTSMDPDVVWQGHEDPNHLGEALESAFSLKGQTQGGYTSDAVLRWQKHFPKGCIYRNSKTRPEDCHCYVCEPDKVATKGHHRYFHTCRGCRFQFRCLPSVPMVIGGPVALNKPCRCIESKGRHFCSNQCFWKWNGPVDNY